MLQQIHDKAKGWVAYAIVGFIAIPFTLFGISSYLGGSNSLVAAVVNDEDISVQQVQNDVLRQRQRLSQMFGGKIPPGFNDDAIKKQVLEQIVSATLLRQESEKNGYRASNQEVFDVISQDPAFQKNDVFDGQTYDRILTSQRRNKSTYEQGVRDSLSSQQLPKSLTETAFLPVDEIKRYGMLQNQTRDIDIYTLKKDDFKSEASVSDEEVKKYYDSNSSRYMTADKVKLSYIELKQSDLEKDVDVTDEALQTYYDENANRYIEAEQRNLSHILVKIDIEKNGENAEKMALEKADALYKQIKDGSKTFKDLAKSDSDDRFSAKKEGEMGLVIQADMGPLFGKQAFSMKKGEVSKPVKAEAGFEIIKVVDIIETKQKTFEEVKSEIEGLYRKEESEKLFFDQSDKLQTLAFENESNLDVAADAIGKQVQTSDWVEKGVASPSNTLFSSPKLLAIAFGNDVLNLGKNSELIKVNESNVVIIRLQEHQVPKQKPLADVTTQITSALTDQKLRKVLIEKGEKVLKSLRDSGSWSSVAAIGGSEDKLEKHVALKRKDAKVHPTVLDKVFSMQKPQDGKNSFDNVILPAGDYVLMGLSGVSDGEIKEADETQANFTRMLAQREQDAMLKALRSKAEVKLFLNNIQ